MSKISGKIFTFLLGFIPSLLLLINIVILAASWGYPLLVKHNLFYQQDGPPVGGDFRVFYAASSLVLEGKAAEVFEPARLNAAIKKTVGREPGYMWHYPPTFLLLATPFSLLPYVPSLLLWLGATLGIYLAIIRRIAPHRLTPLLLLAFYATKMNFSTGQNGFLSGALLGGGLLLLESHPLLGGMLLGSMVYKPHLGVLIPVALVAGRCWRALGGTFLSAAGLILLSLLVLGPEAWAVFFKSMQPTTGLLHRTSASGVKWLERMPSLFAAVRTMGGGAKLAWVLQGAVMLGVSAGVAWVWRRQSRPPVRNAALILAALLFPPFLFYYDLAVLALPLAWLGWDGFVRGWQSWQPGLLTLGWLSPLLMYILVELLGLHFPIAALVLGGLLIYTIWASYKDNHFISSNN